MTTTTVRVVRIIGRLNIGGPAIQAITLTHRLGWKGYETLLIRGREEPREGSMDYLANELGVRPVRVPGLQRRLGLHDFRALWGVMSVFWRFRPSVLHTHAAKAGTIGRLGAFALGRAGPAVRVHTFHGHVLEGYFHPVIASAFSLLERWLAKRTSRLVAVSPQVKADLVRLAIAPSERIEVIPLGFELSRFRPTESQRQEEATDWRRLHRIPRDAQVVLLVARLAPIKRIDRFLRIARVVSVQTPARFVILGDGDLYEGLRTSADARALGGQLVWAGFEADVAPALFGSDLVVLTSDNEGTPVSLIEAHAAGLPVVCTDVGGVREVVSDEVSGYVCARDDEAGMAHAIVSLLGDPQRGQALGLAGRDEVVKRFRIDRLVDDVDDLYKRLLVEAEAGR